MEHGKNLSQALTNTHVQIQIMHSGNFQSATGLLNYRWEFKVISNVLVSKHQDKITVLFWKIHIVVWVIKTSGIPLVILNSVISKNPTNHKSRMESVHVLYMWLSAYVFTSFHRKLFHTRPAWWVAVVHTHQEISTCENNTFTTLKCP